MNISSTTYKNYLTDPDKAEAMRMIDDYIAGVQFTSAQMGKLKEISTIFGLKATHGWYEAQAPVQIKGEVKLDIDEIRSTIKEINKGKAIDVEYDICPSGWRLPTGYDYFNPEDDGEGWCVLCRMRAERLSFPSSTWM